MATKPVEALCPELEAFILSEVARLRIVPHGILPKTVKGVVKVRMPVLSDAFVDDSGRHHIYIWAGKSTKTIWSTPAVNVAFRAWHDSTHIRTGLGMTPTEEIVLARQIDLETVGVISHEARMILYAETAGQIAHFEKHDGAFPENQRAFVKAYAAGTWDGRAF